MVRERMRSAWAPLALAGLAALLMWRVVLGGQAFVPANLLRYAAPWSAAPNADAMPTWNPLLYDSVGQFYPWRHFAAESLRSGTIPLWNPYAFCGTPFMANSQSAVFYPGNLLYWLLPTATAAGLSVLLHLVLAGVFMWALVRRLARSDAAGFVAGCAFMLSGWQVAWLHLPTFLATSCWIPLGVLLTLRLFERASASRAAGLGACVGMMLLAGHLQVAAYGLMAVLCAAVSGAWRLWAGAKGQQDRLVVVARSKALFVAALALGAMLSAPQVLPALELSKRSHRVGAPSAEGYKAYTDYAVGQAHLATLLVPGYLGEPAGGEGPYRGVSKGNAYFNYAEGAMYVGVTTLLLAALAFGRRRRDDEADPKAAWLLGSVGVLALLIAFATPIDALLYFHVPGFGQSGSPGRALVLWAFAVSGLAGMGAGRLLRGEVGLKAASIAAGIGLVALAGVYLLGASGQVLPGLEDNAPYIGDLPRQIALLVLAAGAAIGAARSRSSALLTALPAALVAVDLLAAGVNINPTAPREAIYPETPLIARLRDTAGHDRVMPVNKGWSFLGPRAVLPPNGGVALGMRDVQGYDSLFPGQYKQWMNRLAGRDSSPPEVGNMVFARDPLSPMARLLGVRCVLSLEPIAGLGGGEEQLDGAWLYTLPEWPGRVRMADGQPLPPVSWEQDAPTRVSFRATTPAGRLVLADQRYPGWQASVDGKEARIEAADGIFRCVDVKAGEHRVEYRYEPQGFRVGLYLALVALLVALGAGCNRRWTQMNADNVNCNHR